LVSDTPTNYNSFAVKEQITPITRRPTNQYSEFFEKLSAVPKPDDSGSPSFFSEALADSRTAGLEALLNVHFQKKFGT